MKRYVTQVLLLAASIALFALGSLEATGWALYLFPIPLYFALQSMTPLQGIAYGFNYGIFLGTITLIWISREDFALFYIAVSCYIVIFMGLFALYAWVNRKYQSDIARVFLFGAGFLVINIVAHYISYVQAFLRIDLVPTYFDWVMPFAGSAMIDALVLFFGFLVGAVAQRIYKKQSLLPLTAYALILLTLLSVGLYRKHAPDKKTGDYPTVKIAAIQGNFSYEWAVRRNEVDVIYEYYMEATQKAAEEGARIVIWPEYALPVNILTGRPDMKEGIESISKEQDIVVVLGIAEDLTEAEKTQYPGKDQYDTALVFDPRKGLLTPYRAPYPFNDNVLKGQTELITYDTLYGRFTIINCFEIARHKFVADYIAQEDPADFLIVIGNAQRLSETVGIERLKNHARRIAGENNRYLVYVTNTGPTVIYDNHGELEALLPYDTQAYLIRNIPKISEVLPYSKLQELLPLGVVGLLLLGGLYRRK